ncbi:MAG: queuosine precursor transporter [Paramuribaculum sp.]|nr:queuosine precursor transporter [Paramuribaculum sp.]MDE6782263.1 queuosine precursor transporter [Paramuribaculum sp.]
MYKDNNRHALSPTFLILTVVFCICLVVANLMEIKTVSIGPLALTAGVVVFPLSYIISDCIVEIYGFRRARFVIWLGFSMNLLVCILLQLGLWLPGDAQWHGQEAMELIFGAVPRILLASFTAFICGSMVNAYVMSRMKAGHTGTRGFSARAIISTLWGEGTDSCIFFPLAFAGTFPWSVIGSLIVTQTLIKTLYEILILPVTLRIVRRLRVIEGGDADDTGISYKWWKINEI